MNKSLFNKVAGLAIAGYITLSAQLANADIIVPGDIWRFSTNVFTANDTPTDPTLGLVPPGTVLSVNVDVDTTQLSPNFDTSSAFNVFRSPDAIINFEIFDLSNPNDRFFGDTLNSNVIVSNRQAGDTITFSVSNGLEAEGFGGIAPPTNVFLSFFDPTGNSFDSAQNGFDAFDSLILESSPFEDNVTFALQDSNGNDFANFARPIGIDPSIRATLIQGAPATAAVPEPGTVFVLGIGLGLLAYKWRKDGKMALAEHSSEITTPSL